jgi:cysteinyl-tRNA synthetase
VLRLTDTLERGPATVLPPPGEPLRVYACGPTVYRPVHIGNLRTFLTTDLIVRTAEVFHGRSVRLVQNVTDVGHLAGDDPDRPVPDDGRDTPAAEEDKVLAAARAEGRSAVELTRGYEARFRADAAALNLRPADGYPRASESIGLMLDLVERLLRRGNAYLGTDGSVYFDARSFPGYGELSGNRLADLRPGHRRAATSLAGGKRFHADWALWRRAPGRAEMTWDSPWGRGFPGWHLECSAMSLHHLGERIDVHTGGSDLRFPHHEDERAQTEAAVGHPVVRHWVHSAHLLAAGRKMAKSTGNVVVLGDVAAAGRDPLALRLLFLGGRYRQPFDFSWSALAAADTALRRWRARLARWAQEPAGPPAPHHLSAVQAALDDDLDTAGALSALARLDRDRAVPGGAKLATVEIADRVLGLELSRDARRAPAGPLPAGAERLLGARSSARRRRDYAAADRLRDQLAALGVQVADTPDGQVWTVAEDHPGRSAPDQSGSRR